MNITQNSITVARMIYVVICELAGLAIAMGTGTDMWKGLLGGLLVAGFFILIERLMLGFSLRGFSTATFGLGVGLFCAWLLTRVGISELINVAFNDLGGDSGELGTTLALALNVSLFASLGFLGAVLAMRSDREDFAFIIPYVRFRQDAASGQPLLADVEVLVDGRLVRLLAAGFLNGRLIIPRFVLDELHLMANSSSASKRQRGQRGLGVLDSLKENPSISLTIHEARGIAEEDSLQTRLTQSAKVLSARLLTVDESLTKVAHVRGLDVINLHELSEALKPSVEVGERLNLALVRAGKDEHQAVGYLPDGTMIVVNQAIAKIGTTQDVTVISMLQTSAGQMVFAELTEAVKSDNAVA
ncbi:MAG: PIN/TRAM domain-containing protein [Verrucomicrobiales bacterium]